MSPSLLAPRALRTLGSAALALVTLVPSPEAPAAQPRGAPVVVAVIDDGVNPYHDDFAARTTEHPSTRLPGYPRMAPALSLTLDADFGSVRRRDAATWKSIREGTLYWIPGTKISGVVRIPDTAVQRATNVNVSTAPGSEELPVVDNNTHGTRVASVAVGAVHGACRACELVVVDTQDFAAGLRWVAHQPWIDVVVNSWSSLGSSPAGGTVAGVPAGGDIDVASREVAAAGKVVVFAAGNGATGLGPYARALPDRSTTLLSPATGPPWALTVGAASPVNQQSSTWHNTPVDVVSYGQDWPAASAVSTREEATFFGTSCAAPIVGGTVAEALRRLRQLYSGHKRGSALWELARAVRRPARGPLADGRLTRVELVQAALAAAEVVPADLGELAADPAVVPTTPVAMTHVGHGLLRARRAAVVLAVLRGVVAGRDLTDPEARFLETVRDTRVALWGAEP